MTLNVAQSLAIEQKVLANHLNITEPVPPILLFSIVFNLHDECSRDIVKAVTTLHRRTDVFNVFLPLRPTDNHLLNELARGLGVRMNAIGTMSLDEGIATVVELGYVTAKVLDQSELATRMLPFVTVEIED